MTDALTSADAIGERQDRWGRAVPRDPLWPFYAATVPDNLFLRRLHPETETEFRKGDGSELKNTPKRPAKMRALASSSALAVNFFDAWRGADKGALARALGLPSPITALNFEHKPTGYPVRPRSPNLDLMLLLADGQRVAVESKFSEPYRSGEGFAGLSARYFPDGKRLWSQADLPAAQALADRLRPESLYLDVPQLLKHLLGLASDPTKPRTLMYLWFDTRKGDADLHRTEIERFARALENDAVAFKAASYQEVFASLTESVEPVVGWHRYARERYF